MDNISKLMTDPAWWFTVVLVGIVVSLFASYIRSGVDKGLSLISIRYKKRKELKDKVRSEEFELLIMNSSMLLIESVKTILLFISFLFMIILSILLWFFYHAIPPLGITRVIAILCIVAVVLLLFILEIKAFLSLGRILAAYDVHKDISKKTVAARHNQKQTQI